MPRANLKPTAEQRNLVKSLAACGITHEQICTKIGVRSPKTLRKHFRRELDLGEIDANYNVGQRMYKKADSGNVEAGKFWLIYRAGWGRHPHGAAPRDLPAFIVAREPRKKEDEGNEN